MSGTYTSGHNPNPDQVQSHPGSQVDLNVAPLMDKLPPDDPNQGNGEPQLYKAAGKLKGKVALITGGDSGIGASTAILFAMEGVKQIIFTCLPEEKADADKTKERIEKLGCKVQVISEDFNTIEEKRIKSVIEQIVKDYGELNILVNNSAYQMEKESISELSEDQIRLTFNVNIIALMLWCKHAVQVMKPGSTIINNASINHYIGHPKLLDYTATKGAIVAFTRALSNQIVSDKGIRVNAVAPGPIYTPLINSTMGEESRKSFGANCPIGRPGQPVEVATCFVFLASSDSSYITASVLHPNGGTPTGA